MDKLYLYLLNRKPTLEEKKKNRNKSLKLVNQEICQSQEYRNFLNDNYKLLKTRIKVIFGVETEIEERVIYNLYEFLRKNNYSISELDKYLNNCKGKYNDEMKMLLRKLKLNKFKDNNIFLINYINNGFVNTTTINDIIYSDYFFNFVQRKLQILFE